MTRVVVYVQPNCPACHAHLPKVRAAADKHKIQLRVVDISMLYGEREAAKHHVRATPTTDVFTSRGTLVRRVGALPDELLDRLLAAAV